MKISVYTDGASRKNPGESASGYLIRFEKEEILECFYNGKKTNSEAEYIAVILAFKKINSLNIGEKEVFLYSDSEFMINQLKGIYKIRKPELRQFYEEVISISKNFSLCTYEALQREDKNISAVDYNLNRLLDKMENNKK